MTAKKTDKPITHYTEADGVSPFADTVSEIIGRVTTQPDGTDLSLHENVPMSADDRYRVISTIGEGGMGRVLEVIDQQFGRQIALKELLPDAKHQEGRFIVEAVVTANLEHPGIVPVYERGRRSDGSLFYTMRRVRGRSLSEAIDGAKSMRDRLALLSTIIGVAQTLAFAHERGVIHRDIKPENVFVGPHGEAFVLDWGIAKVRGVVSTSKGPEDAPQMPVKGGKTQAGAVFGTPSYMAPEQARGDIDSIDERTDVFCLGALLYHLIGGRAPYDGSQTVEVLLKAQTVDMAPIDELAPTAPAALLAIVKRAMQKEPRDRYATAGDLADELRLVSSDALMTPPSKGVEIYSRVVETIVCAIAVGASVLGLVMGQRFVELGFVVMFVMLFTVMGLTLSFFEWRGKGRPALSHLAFAIAVSTFIGAVIGTALGESMTLHAAEAMLANEAQWREIVTVGTRESIGNLAIGGELTVLQLIAWAIVKRSVTRAERKITQSSSS